MDSQLAKSFFVFQLLICFRTFSTALFNLCDILEWYSGNADFFVQIGVFVSFSSRIVLCRFKRRLKKKKRRLNGVFPFSQSQGIDKNAVYRFKRSSLSFILLTNQ